MIKGPITTLLCGATVLFCSTLLGAPQYISSVIEAPEEIHGQAYADLNGDDLRDLLLSVWSEQRGRELLVYLQGSDGQFPGKPSQRIEIKKDIIAYGLAELREEPGEELLFLTRNSAYSYSSRKEGYAGNLEQLFEWELLTTVPERKSLAFIGRLEDYNNDGHADALLPGRERYALFYGDGNGGFGPAVELPVAHSDPERSRSNNAGFRVSQEDGLTFSVESPSAFAGLFPERSEPDGGNRFDEGQSIMDVERWLANVRSARINEDTLSDFVYLDHPEKNKDKSAEDQSQRFNVVYQSAEGVNSSAADWRQALKSSEEILVVDFNGDGLDDVLALESKGNKQTNVAFFANRTGNYNFQSPDQVLRFSGYEVEAQLLDLNGDDYPELIISHYSLAAVDALRSASMLRSTLIYAGNPAASEQNSEGLAFARRPTTKMDDKFSAASVKGLTERPHFSADLTGDGRSELLALDDNGALVARMIAQNLQIDAEPFWRFVPLHLIQSVMPEMLNDDKVTDFVLLHQNAVSVLVSRP